MQLKFPSAVSSIVKFAIVVLNVIAVLLLAARLIMDNNFSVKVAMALFAVDIIYIVPLILFTYYKFEDDYLLIHDYPLRTFKIDYKDIFNVEDGDFETKNKSIVALSFNRVAIGYKKHNKDDSVTERYVYVSPKDMNLFLIRLSARLQQSKIDIEEKAKEVSLKQQEHLLKKKLADEKREKEAKAKEPEIIKVKTVKGTGVFKTEVASSEEEAKENIAEQTEEKTAEELESTVEEVIEASAEETVEEVVEASAEETAEKTVEEATENTEE